MQAPEVTKAFEESKSQRFRGGPSQEAKPPAAPAPAPGPSALPSPPRADTGDTDKGGSEGRILNWVTLSIQQDLVFQSKTPNACGIGSRYECFDAAGQRELLTLDPNAPNQILFAPGGNQISGSGASPGTLRILLGYERVVHPNVSLGIRVGSVVSGKALKNEHGHPFLVFSRRGARHLVGGSRCIFT